MITSRLVLVAVTVAILAAVLPASGQSQPHGSTFGFALGAVGWADPNWEGGAAYRASFFHPISSRWDWAVALDSATDISWEDRTRGGALDATGLTLGFRLRSRPSPEGWVAFASGGVSLLYVDYRERLCFYPGTGSSCAGLSENSTQWKGGIRLGLGLEIPLRQGRIYLVPEVAQEFVGGDIGGSGFGRSMPSYGTATLGLHFVSRPRPNSD